MSLPRLIAPSGAVIDANLILHAMRRAVAQALEEHRRIGNPVAIWRNGRVEVVRVEDLTESERPQATTTPPGE